MPKLDILIANKFNYD